MFGLGSSSSSNDPPPAPTREERRKCWAARDAYFECLTSNQVVIPGRENKNADNTDIKGGGSICRAERDKYGKDCGKTWVRSAVPRWRQGADLRSTISTSDGSWKPASNYQSMPPLSEPPTTQTTVDEKRQDYGNRRAHMKQRPGRNHQFVRH